MGTMKLAIVNGSPSGEAGNCGAMIQSVLYHFPERVAVSTLTLADVPSREVCESVIRGSDGFLFVTGTYWDSWGSPLQRFFEEMTYLEATDAWVGKPAGGITMMHSVGGKGVLSRLFGVLNTFGCSIPPFAGVVYSYVGQVAGESSREAFEDLWSLDDLSVLAHNLTIAIEGRGDWRTWPVDTGDSARLWLRTPIPRLRE
jgi:chromate reductase, NAD(P)H dehydrogenase (quinone)